MQSRRNNRSRDTLTGGSGDVKPQLLSFAAAQSAADTTTSVAQALPVLRNFSGPSGRAQIIEVLKVWFDVSTGFATVNGSVTKFLLGTKNFGTTAVTASDPSIFAFWSMQAISTASGTQLVDRTKLLDLTDGNGNGVLVATDSIFCQIVSASTALANAANVKVLYRVYDAGVTEYVGIVQGQQ